MYVEQKRLQILALNPVLSKNLSFTYKVEGLYTLFSACMDRASSEDSPCTALRDGSWQTHNQTVCCEWVFSVTVSANTHTLMHITVHMQCPTILHRHFSTP